MKYCNCIVIDDKKGFAKSALISNFLQRVEKNDIRINLIQLNPKDEQFVNENGEIVKARIEEELNTSKYLRQDVHLIICDYDLADEYINGFDIVQLLRNELKSRKKILLYSSNIDNVVEKIITGNKDIVIKQIIDLVKVNILEFCKRDEHLVEAIFKHLKEESIFSSDNYFETQLYKYQNYTFKAVYDKFQNFTLGEIVAVIKARPDEGELFKKEMIEQVVAYMINIEDE
jgi:hypothetical protein